MTGTARRVLGEAMKLSPEERAAVAFELLASLEPDSPSQARNDSEWIQEIERRARAAPAGSAGVPWDAARDEIQSRLADR